MERHSADLANSLFAYQRKTKKMKENTKSILQYLGATLFDSSSVDLSGFDILIRFLTSA